MSTTITIAETMPAGAGGVAPASASVEPASSSEPAGCPARRAVGVR